MKERERERENECTLLCFLTILFTQRLFVYLFSRELIEIIRQLNEMSNAVKEALIGIVVRKKLQHKHYKHKALNYTKNASP